MSVSLALMFNWKVLITRILDITSHLWPHFTQNHVCLFQINRVSNDVQIDDQFWIGPYSALCWINILRFAWISTIFLVQIRPTRFISIIPHAIIISWHRHGACIIGHLQLYTLVPRISLPINFLKSQWKKDMPCNINFHGS